MGAEHHNHDHCHHDSCGYCHDHEYRNVNKKRLQIAFMLVFGMMIAELIGGVFSGSVALVSDGTHMLVDGFVMGCALYAASIFDRKPRAEHYAAFINSLVLLLMAVYIFYGAYSRFIYPREIECLLMTVVAVAGLIINIIQLFVVHGCTLKDVNARAIPRLTRLFFAHDSDQENINMRAACLHILSDTLSSCAVVGGGLIIWFTGWTIIDPILGLIIGLAVLRYSLYLITCSSRLLFQNEKHE